MQETAQRGTKERAFRSLFENSHRWSFLIGLGLFLAACGTPAPTDRPPVSFTEARTPQGGDDFVNWPLAPDLIETEVVRALREMRFEPVSSRRTATGISGASEVTLLFPDFQKELKFKWKPTVSSTLDGDNNSPRREIASYEIQKLFLDPEDYVVPTSLMVCLPAQWYPEDGEVVPPLAPGSNCVLGNLSVWLQNVTQPDVLYEEARFLEDPDYAYFLANLNLFTYLVAHHDGKPSNYLISKEKNRPQVFSIDNGVSFRSWFHNPFATNWDVIRVPAFRRDSVDRLREIDRGDLEVLGVVAQLEKNDEGLLISVPPGDNLDPGSAVVITDDTVQLGLTEGEIDDLWHRIQDVIDEVDSGRLPVF